MDFAIITALVMGITEVFKRTGLSKRWVPLVSLILGLVIASVFAGTDKDSLLQGLVSGLTAMGIWSGTKATVKG